MNMDFRFAAAFDLDYKHLPSRLQTALERKLGMLLANPKHPSLRVKKMEGFDGIFEARFSKGYRFTFQKEGYGYLIRRAGPPDVLKHP